MSSARGASLRVVLASIGSRGDVQPMLAIAQALAARGHRALIAAPPDFEAFVRAFGIEFAPLGIDVNAFMQRHRDTLGANIAKFFHSSRKLFEAELPGQLDALLELGRGADAIVFAAAAAAAPSAGEKLRLPVLGVLFTTCVVPSREHAPVVVPWRTLPKWLNALAWAGTRFAWNILLRKGLNAARSRHGLPPLRDVTTHLFEESRYVVAVDAEVFPLEPSWHERTVPVGFLFVRPNETALDPALEAWLREGDPPVYVGFGSMMGKGPDRMRAIIVEAIAATGRRALVGAGWAGLGANALPNGWRVAGDTPHELLFPRVACVVHHGGSGTTAAALRTGVPQVLVPLILDQYHHAQRLYELGIAPRPIPMERITSAQLGASIREALCLPADPRDRIAQRLRSSRAADAIVDRIESMIATV